MSVEDNVAFGLERKGVPKGELKGASRRCSSSWAWRGSASASPSSSRAAAAAGRPRPRAREPPARALLDEPLGALDLKLRKQMQLELKRIQHEVGITFVHVTHDQEEAMTMADQIAVMNRGHIEQLGKPTELYERPATAFVAGFLGARTCCREPSRDPTRSGSTTEPSSARRSTARPRPVAAACGRRRSRSGAAGARTSWPEPSRRPRTSASRRRSS